MRTLLIKTIGILIIVLLSACNFPGPGQPAPDAATASNTVESSQDYASTECAFMWANESLPELSADFNQAIQDIAGAEGYAQAYGENCVTNEGDVLRFLAMETDFYVTLKVDNLENKQVLGELVEQTMEALAEFPTDETPGPQPGYVGIIFEAPEDSLRLWVMRTEIEIALENGLRGAELFQALQAK
jgi:hypothetical protein